MLTEAVRYEFALGVARITLADGPAGNPLTAEALAGLSRSLALATGNPDCRAIVIAAEGPDFCRGLDLGLVLENECERQGRVFFECLTRIAGAAQPVIACVEGRAVGGGVGLVAACDLVIARASAVFQLSEVIVGMIPALIAPFLLERLTPARARYLTLSSRGIPASEAHLFGLVDEVSLEALAQTCNRQLQRLLRSSPEALAASKRYLSGPGRREQQGELAVAELCAWLKDPEHVAGIRCFAEGLAPPWFEQSRTASHA